MQFARDGETGRVRWMDKGRERTRCVWGEGENEVCVFLGFRV